MPREELRSALKLPLCTVRISKLQPARTPSSRFSHLPRVFGRAALFFLLPAVLLVTFFAFRFTRHNSTSQFQAPGDGVSVNSQNPLDLSATLARRPVFPYSVVPGGVRDAHELQKAAAVDKVVAKHYSDFQIAKARTVSLDHPVAMYVSYRRNNQVFWTKNKMVIPAGESLISDGENLARMRCANRLSVVAALPVAVSEPTKEELSTPQFDPLVAQFLPASQFGLFPQDPSNVPVLPLLPPGPHTSSNSSQPPFTPPLVPPGTTPNTPNNPEPPPVSTPESSSFVLLFAGSVLVTLLAAFSMRRNSAS
jgi:hypothetical protein